VSTDGQTPEAQQAALAIAGCTRICAEKISGKARANRPQLERLLKTLRPGDQVIITHLGGLARSTRDLLNVLNEVGEAGARFKSLA